MANTTELYTILVQTSGADSDVRGLVRELDRANKAMQGTQRAASTMQRSTESVNRSMNRMRADVQNFGFQVQDVFVQVAGGTSIFRSLGQQVPQMASVFGIWGVAVGTVAAAMAALLPMLANFDSEADRIKQMADDVQKAVTAVGTLQSTLTAVQDARRSIAEAAASGSDRSLESVQREIAARRILLRLDRDQAQRDLRAQEAAVNARERELDARERAAREAIQAQFDLPAADVRSVQEFLVLQRRLNDEMAIWARENRTASEEVARQEANLVLARLAFEDLDGSLEATGDALNRMSGGDLFEVMAPPPERAAAAERFYAIAQEGIESVATAQDQAAQSADTLRQAVAAVERGLINLPADQVVLLKQALSEAEVAAMGLSDAVTDVQKRMDRLNASAFQESLSGVASEARLAALQAGASVDEARIQAQLIQQAAETYPEAAAENLDFIVKSTPALQAYEAELRKTAATEAEINAILEDRREAERGGSGGGSRRRGLTSLEREIQQAQAALERFIASQRTAGEAMDATIREVSDSMTLLEGQLSADVFGPLADSAEQAIIRLRENGPRQIVEDFIDAQRTAEEQTAATFASVEASLESLRETMDPAEWQQWSAAVAVAMERARTSTSELSDYGRIVSNSFNNAFDEIIDGTGDLSDSFADLMTSMAKDLASFVFSQAFQTFLASFGPAIGSDFVTSILTPQAAPQAGPSALGRARLAFEQPVGVPSQGFGSRMAVVSPSPLSASALARAQGRGSNAPGVVVNIENRSNAEIGVSESVGPDGEQVLDMIIEQKVQETFARGSMDSTMQRTYGLRRRPA